MVNKNIDSAIAFTTGRNMLLLKIDDDIKFGYLYLYRY